MVFCWEFPHWDHRNGMFSIWTGDGITIQYHPWPKAATMPAVSYARLQGHATWQLFPRQLSDPRNRRFWRNCTSTYFKIHKIHIYIYIYNIYIYIYIYIYIIYIYIIYIYISTYVMPVRICLESALFNARSSWQSISACRRWCVTAMLGVPAFRPMAMMF